MTETYTYRIDRENNLVSVGENWRRFAVENAGAASMMPDSLIGKALDFYIEDEETRALYAMVLDSVRRSNRPVAFDFRCDAPAERRFCELRIMPRPDGSVDFESRIVRTETREPMLLLDPAEPRDPDEFLKACSTCKRIAMGESQWVEIEQAMPLLRLNERARTPRITHGLCEECHERIVASL